jgi:hypothetical protein
MRCLIPGILLVCFTIAEVCHNASNFPTVDFPSGNGCHFASAFLLMYLLAVSDKQVFFHVPCFSVLDTVDSITPNKVRDVRTFLNGSAMDVMYYTSPVYRTEVYIEPYYRFF